MAFSLERTDPLRRALEPGHYRVGPAPSGDRYAALAAIVQRTDEECRNTLGDGGPLLAESGDLELEVLAADRVVGRYALTFADGRIAGRLVAVECGAPPADRSLCVPAE